MPDDGNIAEILAKVAGRVAARFGGDYRAAFAHFDADGNGVITIQELNDLLADAGVGVWLTRWAWANGVMGELDVNRDGQVTWAEFEARFRRV